MRAPVVGPVRQMEQEQRAADDAGLPWTSSFYCPAGLEGAVCHHPAGRGSWTSFKRDYYRWLTRKAAGFDVVLLRYAAYDPFQWRFVRDSPVPVITMHHAMEHHELWGDGRASIRARAIGERLLGPLTLSHAIAHAGVTHEIALHERDRSLGPDKPVLVYSNGAFYDDDCVVPAALGDGPHELLLMSSKYSSWAGLDLLNDAAERSDLDFIVHVVGQLTDEQRQRLSRDPRFRVHGYLDMPAIDALVVRATIGLSTFAIHRKRMSEGNTLKVREYLRAGLPVYAGYRDVFDEHFPYYRQGETDFGAILAFADEMRSVDRRLVSETTRPFIEKRVVLQGFHERIDALLRARR